MSKRILALVTACMMALLAACGTASNEASQQPASSAPASSATASSQPAGEAPVELTICTVRRTTDITTSYSEKHWVQELEEACNVKINWVELLEGQTDEPLTAMLAGDLPDVFWAGGIISDSIISQNTSLWRPLTEEEIRTHVPNLANFLDENLSSWLDIVTYPDGNIYGLPGGKLHSTMHVSSGIPYINTRWLENLGLQKPTTMEELKNVLIAFRDQDANGNGDPNDEIPFDFCDNFFASQALYNAASWGLPLTGSVFYDYDADGNVIGAVNTDAYREFLEYFHELGAEGLLNQEGFAQSYDQYTANLNADKVGFFWGWGPCNYITDSELFLQFEGIVQPAAEGYETKMYTANIDFANAYRNNFVLTRSCKDWEKALEIWNYVSDPTTALNICNGERFLFWDYIDESGNFLGEDATEEQIKACGYHYFADHDNVTDEQLTEWNYDWLIGKTFTGANTVGLVNIAPVMLEAESYRTDDLTVWGVQRYVAISEVLEPANAFCKYHMPNNIVPADVQEEYDFMTDGLTDAIRGFCATSIMNGVTDESWNNYLNDLKTYNYDYYIEHFNKVMHNNLSK
ncbi:MAG: hypothetical protein HFG27_10655 [Provencibacterium sp.]|jgi:putative aldouronate transport system substrate-binding protein|nr:hypothetical protein [Provencibacterium sp.]